MGRFSALAVVLLFVSTPHYGVELSVEESTVQVAINPGGSVRLLGVIREEIKEAYSQVSIVEELLEDDDRDGTIKFDFERTIPVGSIWVAVNDQTGASSASTPKEFHLRTPTEQARLRDGTVTIPGRTVQFLLVRPGKGAWSGTVRGRPLEPDEGGHGADRVVEVRPTDLAASSVRDDNPPARFRGGDVLVVVDPDRMEFSEVRF